MFESGPLEKTCTKPVSVTFAGVAPGAGPVLPRQSRFGASTPVVSQYSVTSPHCVRAAGSVGAEKQPCPPGSIWQLLPPSPLLFEEPPQPSANSAAATTMCFMAGDDSRSRGANQPPCLPSCSLAHASAASSDEKIFCG